MSTDPLSYLSFLVNNLINRNTNINPVINTIHLIISYRMITVVFQWCKPQNHYEAYHRVDTRLQYTEVLCMLHACYIQHPKKGAVMQIIRSQFIVYYVLLEYLASYYCSSVVWPAHIQASLCNHARYS